MFLFGDDMLIYGYVRDSHTVKWSDEADVEEIEPEKRSKGRRLRSQWEESDGGAVIQSRRSARVGPEITALGAKRSETQLWNDKHDGVRQTHQRGAHMSSFKVEGSSRWRSSAECDLLAGSQPVHP